MKAVFLSKCQPKGENVLFCESVILLLWYPSILLTPLARYYKDVRILLQIYLFIYLFIYLQHDIFCIKWKLEKNEPQIKNTIYLSIYFVLFVYLILSNVQKGYEVHNGWCK